MKIDSSKGLSNPPPPLPGPLNSSTPSPRSLNVAAKEILDSFETLGVWTENLEKEGRYCSVASAISKRTGMTIDAVTGVLSMSKAFSQDRVKGDSNYSGTMKSMLTSTAQISSGAAASALTSAAAVGAGIGFGLPLVIGAGVGMLVAWGVGKFCEWI